MKKILILGSTGFVGRNLSEELEKDKNFHLVLHKGRNDCNLLELKETKEYIKAINPNIIINCAANVGSLNYVSRHAADIMHTNSLMLLNIYESIKYLKHKSFVINPIANCAFPSTAVTFEEDRWLDGPLHSSVMSYGFTRRMIWHLGESYKLQHDINSYYFFVPNMYGPYDSTDPDKAHALNALISKFVKAKFLNEKKVIVWGTGIAIREWLYVKDFARLIRDFLNNKSQYPISEPINIAQNFGLSIKDIVSIICNFFDNKIQTIWDDSMPDGASRKVMNDSKFRKYFPNFEFTILQEGIIETIRYYESIYPY